MMAHTDDDAPTSEVPSETGFALVEIVVAMFILAILAVSFLPILIQGLQLSATNATRATATQLVHEQLEYAHSIGSVCSVINGLNDTSSLSPVEDPRGIKLITTREVPSCATSSTSYPRTIELTVTVKRQDNDEVQATASTLIYVDKRIP